MVPQTKQGRHINMREHWVRECATSNCDVIFAHVKSPLNPSNLLTKVDVATTYKRESKWLTRGIHDAKYQADLRETAAALAKRDFDWNSQLELDIKKRAAAADHIDVAKRLAHAEQISAKSKL